MHVIIGLLGSVVTILWLLHRLAEMGIDLGGLNPFLWRRRRKWRKRYDANPIFSLDDPLEAAALLITATAKADGDMSADEKREILAIFEHDLHLSRRDAAGLLISSSHLLGRGDELREHIEKILAPSLPRYSAAQAQSTLDLLRRVAAVGGAPTDMQADLIERASGVLTRVGQPKGTWE